MTFARVIKGILTVAFITLLIDGVAFFAIKEISKNPVEPIVSPKVKTSESFIPTFEMYIGADPTEKSVTTILDFSNAPDVSSLNDVFMELLQKPANAGYHYSVISLDSNLWAVNRATGVVFPIDNQYEGVVSLRADSELVIVNNSMFYLLKKDHAETIYTIN